jgi:hypothetical protein
MRFREKVDQPFWGGRCSEREQLLSGGLEQVDEHLRQTLHQLVAEFVVAVGGRQKVPHADQRMTRT